MSGRLRVGYFLADPGVDLTKSEGGAIHVGCLVEGLRKRGHEVRLVAVQPDDEVVVELEQGARRRDVNSFHRLHRADLAFEALCRPELSEMGCGDVEWNAFRHGWGDSSDWGPEIASSCRAYHVGRRIFSDCDVLHVRPGPFDMGALLCARELGIPLVLEVNAAPVEEALAYYPSVFSWRTEGLARAVARCGIKAADAIVPVSNSLGEALVSEWGAEPDKVTVLPNAAPSAGPVPTPERAAALRSKHGLRDGEPIIVFLGGLQPWHGVEFLIRAFASLSAQHGSVRLLIIGDGDMRSKLGESVSSLGIQESVTMVGRLPHPEALELLHLATVGVAPYPRLPIRFHFSPLKIFEYMAAGLPIVASRQGQIAEILTEGESALLVEPGNVDALAAALARVLEDDHLRTDLGRRAREKASQDYTWERHSAHLLELYREVIGAT